MIPLPVIASGEERQRAGLSRRQLLLRGLVGGGLLLVAGVSLRFAQLFDQKPAVGKKVLSAREVTILGSLIEALLPGGEMPAGDPVFLIPWLDHWLSQTAAELRWFVKAMLHVVEDGAILSRFTRFSRLSLKERMQEVRILELTPTIIRRQSFSTLKFVIGLAYFEQPEVNETMGWYLGCSPEHLPNKSHDHAQEVAHGS